MRILYICPHPNIGFDDPSGPGTHIREVVYAMQSMGHEVKVFLASEQQKNFKSNATSNHQPSSSGFKTIIKKILGAFFFETLKDFLLLVQDKKYAKQLEKIAFEYKPDIIYERSYFLCLSGYKTARKFSIAYYLEMNAPATIEKPLMSSSSLFLHRAKRFEKIQIAGCDRLIVVSSALKTHFVKLVPSAEQKVMVVPNAVRSEVKNISSTRASMRESLGISENEITIGFVGSIFPYHGVDLLIESFAEVITTTPLLKLLIVGDGSILPALKEIAAQKGIQSKIIFTGNVPHDKVNEYLSAMDIAVMVKSNWYGSPVKIFEYGAAALPMLCPDTIPVRDVITDGEDALLVSPEKTSVVRALQKLLIDKKSRDEMGQRFHNKVLKKHTWTINVRRILGE